MRVLIAEDEPPLADAIARGLRRAGCAVDVALDGGAALQRAAVVDYDAVVLDRDLPEVHGDDVCRRLVAAERPPRILMLTAATAVAQRCEGLDLGADDYLCKPFAFAELVSRLRALRRVLLAFGLALALVTLASVAAGWIVAGRALRPIKRITATARSISDETLDARIALAGPRDELRELADTFDTMLARLEGAFESRRRFVANASHELRTPLSIVRAELDVTLGDPHATPDELRAMAGVVRDANDRMERLIGSLLDLAGGEAGIAQPRPADLAEAVRPALAAQPALAGGGTITLDAVLEPAPVDGEPVLLERLAANLVENAVRYNAALGWVRVRTGVERGEAVLSVENAGPPVPADEAPALLEPFRRLDASRARATGGYGLGLAGGRG